MFNMNNLLINLLTASTLYLLVLLTSTFYSGYDTKRCIELGIVILALLSIITSKKTTISPRSSTLIIAAIITIGIISSFNSAVPRYAFIEVSMYIGLWALSLCVSSIGHTHFDKRVVLYFSGAMLIAAVIYLSSFFVAYIAAMVEDYPKEWWHLYRGFINIRFFNQYQIWMFPFLTLFYLSKPFGLGKWNKLFAIVIACWWMLLFLSDSRGAIVATLLSIAAVVFLYRSFASAFIKAHVCFAISGCFLYLVVFLLLPFLAFEQSIDSELIRLDGSGRLDLWMSAINLAFDNVLLGIGPMHFAWYPNTHAHPHNAILQWASEWGLITTSLFIILIVRGFYKWSSVFTSTRLSSKSADSININIAVFNSSIAGLSYSLFSGVIVMPMSQVMLAIVAGFMIGLYNCEVGATLKNGDLTSFRMLQKMLFSVSLLLLIISIWPDVRERSVEGYEVDSASMQVMTPRLWQVGGIPHSD